MRQVYLSCYNVFFVRRFRVPLWFVVICLPGTIDLIYDAANCIKGPVPSNGTGEEIMRTKSRPQYYRIRRVLEMVREGTQSGYPANSSDFKRELGVSRRTMAQDLDFLRDEENAPIEYDESGKIEVSREATCAG